MNPTLNIDNKKVSSPLRGMYPVLFATHLRKNPKKINTMKRDETSSMKRVMYNGFQRSYILTLKYTA